MFTDSQIQSINAALSHIAANRDCLRISSSLRIADSLHTLAIRCDYIAPRTYVEFGARVSTEKTCKGSYQATCGLDHGFNACAFGHNPAAAFRNLFKMMRCSAYLSCRRISVPMILSHPTEALAQERAERKARREGKWHADLDRAATAIEAERKAAKAADSV